MEHVFVTCSIDSNPITENVVLSSNSSKPSREFLNFTVDVDELRNFYEFSESKVAVDEAEELASSDKVGNRSYNFCKKLRFFLFRAIETIGNAFLFSHCNQMQKDCMKVR